jgi:hypothetical protein
MPVVHISLNVVLGQWFICIKLFYSLKFPVRKTDTIVGRLILWYLRLLNFSGKVSLTNKLSIIYQENQ